MLRKLLALAALVLIPASPGLAQTPAAGSLPAVSQLNGKFSLESGAVGIQGRSSALGIAQGSIAAPLGHSFGVQVDGLAATAYNSFGGGGAAHLFWRNPAIGLAGPVVALVGARGNTVGWYGGEGELYAGLITVAVYAGYQDAGASAVPSGGFYQGHLSVYPIPDLALTVGGGQFAGRAIGSGRVEYQPDLLARRNVAFFVDANAGDDSFYRVTGGVRLYFGPDKSLIRRHREDDPATSRFLSPNQGPIFDSSYGGGIQFN